MRASLCMILAAVLTATSAGSVRARSSELLLPIKDALESDRGHKVSDLKYFFAGQNHPAVRKTIGEFTANKSTSGMFRGDDRSCQVAFLSALISLQSRALQEGGDAVVDIVSITGNVETSSATEYRCLAGNTVVRVSLRGKVVKL